MKKQFVAAAAVASLAAFAGGTQDAQGRFVAGAQVGALVQPCSVGVEDVLMDPGKCLVEAILASNPQISVSVVAWSQPWVRNLHRFARVV